MAVHSHNRRVESLYKNSHLRGLSYKLAHSPRPQPHFTDLGGGVWVSYSKSTPTTS
ncbi:hypothetical protein MTBBW1_120006 [Desulfamplus magnetovallimortis]|uniref:Uncharacterized protein n=1 Tax=Desulfamplus magnetovallimortis TaxID=1246637 RepID=A0A1W1H671_9BACT|nr:hypothetical protein MTBBW1_120006 [Desulfamplus magnetovallimortis]